MRVSLEELVVAARERGPDPAFDGVSDPVLVEGFARAASGIAAARCRWLLMLAEIVRRGLWVEDGVTSPAAWLSWKVGEAAPTAREHVRVALALVDFPLTTAEFAAGRLSYSKVRAIVSTHRPELDRLLVKFSQVATGQQLHRICGSFNTTDDEPLVDTWAAHHIVHWDDGGPTELYNLVLLCGTHHRFVHDRGWTIATDGRGRFTFTPPDRETMRPAEPLPGIDCPEAVFPEWPDEIPDDVDPWEVWSRSPLTPTGATARPDYNACIEVLHDELARLTPPATQDIVIAA